MTARSDGKVALGVVVVVILLTWSRMFLPHAVGLSDQGDHQRLLCTMGVRQDLDWGQSASAYVPWRWVEHRWVGETCGANGTGQPYRSSELTLLRGARTLTGLLGFDATLDLRALALLCGVILGGLSGALYLVMPGSTRRRLLTVAAVVAIYLDPVFAGYYASGFSEPAAFLGVLAFVVAAIHVLSARRPSVASLVVLATSGTFAITAKTQMVSLLPVVVAALLWRASGPETLGKRARLTKRTRLVDGARRRWPGLVLATVVTALSLVFVAGQPPRFEEVNRFNQVFGTILVRSGHPKADLRALGLPERWADAEGKNILEAPQVTSDPAYDRFRLEGSWGPVWRFYAMRPVRLADLGRVGLNEMASLRLEPYVASYGAESGKPPYTLDRGPGLAWLIFKVGLYLPLLVVVAWVAVVAWAAVAGRGVWRRSPRAPALVAGGLVLAAILQFWAILLTDGLIELRRHLVVVDLMTVLAIVLAASTVTHTRSPESDEVDETAGVTEEDQTVERVHADPAPVPVLAAADAGRRQPMVDRRSSAWWADPSHPGRWGTQSTRSDRDGRPARLRDGGRNAH